MDEHKPAQDEQEDFYILPDGRYVIVFNGEPPKPATRVGAPRMRIGCASMPYLAKMPCSWAIHRGIRRAVTVA